MSIWLIYISFFFIQVPAAGDVSVPVKQEQILQVSVEAGGKADCIELSQQFIQQNPSIPKDARVSCVKAYDI